MKRKTHPIALLLFVVPCILLLAACLSPYSGEEKDGTGSFTISIGSGNSRNVLAWNGSVNSNDLRHEVTLIDSEGEEHFATIPRGGGTAHFTSLPLGESSITVEGIDIYGIVRAVGSLEAIINLGPNNRTVSMGPPPGLLGARIVLASNLLTPIQNAGANPPYTEREITFTVEVFGFLEDADANMVTLAQPIASPSNILTNALTFSGYNVIGNASNGTKTFTVRVRYDGFSLVPDSIGDIEFAGILDLPADYSYLGHMEALRIDIVDGLTEDTAIPVRQGNFVHFGAFAGTSAGGNKYYKLEESITLTSPWNPIGSATTSFSGTFDGQGNTININNINPFYDNGFNFIGLFSAIGNGGTVKNLRLTGSIYASPSGTPTRAGAVVGLINNGTIENVSSSVDITLSGNSIIYVGGIAGMIATPGIIENCYTSGDISATGTGEVYAGGVAGSVLFGASLLFCWTGGDVEASGTGSIGVGGIAGRNSGIITSCVALNSSLSALAGNTRRIAVDGLWNPPATIPLSFGLYSMSPGPWNVADNFNGEHVDTNQAASLGWWEDAPEWSIHPSKSEAEEAALDGGSHWWFGGSPARPRLWFE